MRNTAMIRHLIFDLDGTLVDSCGICVDILTDMLVERKVDHEIDLRYARPYMSAGGQAMVSALLGPGLKDPAADLAEFRARYALTDTPPKALFMGVAEGLHMLRAMGFTLSICSNKPQNLCEKVLEDTGLRKLFSVVVGSRPGLRAKPEADLLDLTLDLLNASPWECIYVGDSELDHQVAAALQIPFKFLTYGYATKNWLPIDSDRFDCFVTLADTLANANPPLPIAAAG